jgi:hypothetical protein
MLRVHLDPRRHHEWGWARVGIKQEPVDEEVRGLLKLKQHTILIIVIHADVVALRGYPLKEPHQ